MNRLWNKVNDCDTLLVSSFDKLEQNIENLTLTPPPTTTTTHQYTTSRTMMCTIYRCVLVPTRVFASRYNKWISTREPNPDNILHLPLNVGLKRKVDFCKGQNYGVHNAGVSTVNDGRQLCLFCYLICKYNTGCISLFEIISGGIMSNLLHIPAFPARKW